MYTVPATPEEKLRDIILERIDDMVVVGVHSFEEDLIESIGRTERMRWGRLAKDLEVDLREVFEDCLAEYADKTTDSSWGHELTVDELNAAGFEGETRSVKTMQNQRSADRRSQREAGASPIAQE